VSKSTLTQSRKDAKERKEKQIFAPLRLCVSKSTLTQSRKDAKERKRKANLCAFAPLREQKHARTTWRFI